jgi:hypothetical protein
MITLQSITLPSKAGVFVSPSTILISTRPQVMQREGRELMSAVRDRSVKMWEQLQNLTVIKILMFVSKFDINRIKKLIYTLFSFSKLA